MPEPAIYLTPRETEEVCARVKRLAQRQGVLLSTLQAQIRVSRMQWSRLGRSQRTDVVLHREQLELLEQALNTKLLDVKDLACEQVPIMTGFVHLQTLMDDLSRCGHRPTDAKLYALLASNWATALMGIWLAIGEKPTMETRWVDGWRYEVSLHLIDAFGPAVGLELVLAIGGHEPLQMTVWRTSSAHRVPLLIAAPSALALEVITQEIHRAQFQKPKRDPYAVGLDFERALAQKFEHA